MPGKFVDFILSNSQVVKNLFQSDYFTIGGESVYRYVRWGKSIHNGVIFLINSKDYKKLVDYLSLLFSIDKEEKFKANLLKAVLY